MDSERISVFFKSTFIIFAVSPAFGGQILQDREHELMEGMVNIPLSFDAFDDDSGRRRLTSVDISYEGEMEFSVEVLNFDNQQYETGEWFVDAYLNTLLAFAEQPDYEDGGPFFGLGGISITQITGQLGPGNGGGPFGGVPGEPTVESFASGAIVGFVSTDSNLEYFQVDQPLQAVIGPLSDLVVTPPPGAFFIDVRPKDINQQGIVTLTYNFDFVGDFNNNDTLDPEDMDLLFEGIRTANPDADLDGNGETDFADAEYLIENVLETYFGDANFDRLFNSVDLIQIFQAAEYEDGVPQNSTWAEGDWNGDQEFNSADLVIAFADGGFENGRRTTALNIPEPNGTILLGLAILGLLVRFDRR